MNIDGIKIFTFERVLQEIVDKGLNVLYLTTDSLIKGKYSEHEKLATGKDSYTFETELVLDGLFQEYVERVVVFENRKGSWVYTLKEIGEHQVVEILEENDLTGKYDMIVRKLGDATVIVFPNPATNIVAELRKQFFQPMGAITGRVPMQGKPRAFISDDIDKQDKDAASRRATNFMIQSEQAHTHGVTGAIYGEALVFAYRSLIDEGKNVLHLTSSYETKGILSKWLSLHAQEKFAVKVPANSILTNLRNGCQTEVISKTRRNLFTYNDYGRLDLELNYEHESLEDIIEGFEHAWESSDHRRDGDRCKYDIVLLDDVLIKIN